MKDSERFIAAARTVDCCCVNRISQQGNKVSTDELLMSGVDQGADELSAGALHAGDDGADVISSGLIKVGRDADVLLRRSCVQG